MKFLSGIGLGQGAVDSFSVLLADDPLQEGDRKYSWYKGIEFIQTDMRVLLI
jgi:hypothetical protein